LGPDAYWRQRTWKRVAVIAAGPGMNVLLALLLPAVAYMIGAPGKPNRIVKHIEQGKPAAHILHVGDEIVWVNGQATPNFDAVAHAIRSSGGKPITVIVVRRGKRLTVGPVKPTRIQGHYALGFNPGWQEQHLSSPAALRRSAS